MNGPKVKVVVGGITLAYGAMQLLAGVGVLPMGQSDPTVPPEQQRALVICMGAVFAAGGGWAIFSAFPGAASRIANVILGLVIVVGLTSLLGWVAIGPGSRGFSSPMAMFGPKVNEFSGRIGFGLVALLGLLVAILMVRSFAERLASRPKHSGLE
jgi:hypothetical protein